MSLAVSKQKDSLHMNPTDNTSCTNLITGEFNLSISAYISLVVSGVMCLLNILYLIKNRKSESLRRSIFYRVILSLSITKYTSQSCILDYNWICFTTEKEHIRMLLWSNVFLYYCIVFHYSSVCIHVWTDIWQYTLHHKTI